MKIFESSIVPYSGNSFLSFDMLYDDVKRFLKDNKIQYQVDVLPNKGCTPEVPWTIIRVQKIISIYFAYNKMFKIEFDEGYTGKLKNGIYIGMPIEEALSIDPTLAYNEEEEDYGSEEGYWMEDNLKTEKVMSITIFIKELLDDDLFFTYEWAK